MTLEEMKQHKFVVSWSGGKDSTATVILMHEYGIPIEKIVYVRMMYDETLPATLPIMTDFVDETKKVFEDWGYTVEIVPSIKTAEELINQKFKRSKYAQRNGKSYGVMSFFRGMCRMTDVKQKTLASLNFKYEMIGICADEKERLERLTDTKQSILSLLGYTQKKAYDLCEKFNLLSPLYKLGIKRDGCWFCPNAGQKERQLLKERYPHLVKKINQMIEMCDYDISKAVSRNNWVRDYYNG